MSNEQLEGNAAKGWKLLPGAELKAEGANHYMQFTNTDPKQSAWALATLKLDPDWGALRVSARIKVTTLKVGPEGWHNARCILNFRTADNKDAGYPQGPLLTADSDWVTQTVTVDIPKNATALIAEITCSKEDRFWTDPEYAKSKVVSEFIEEGLISEHEILETHTFSTEYGYPLYALGFEDSLATIMEELARWPNLHTIGRQGRFAYINTHVAMKMGLEAARAIAAAGR